MVKYTLIPNSPDKNTRKLLCKNGIEFKHSDGGALVNAILPEKNYMFV